MNHQKPAVIHLPAPPVNTTAVAAGIARLILAGDPRLIPAVEDYGRAVLHGQAVPEDARRGFCRAVSQPTVLDAYCQMVLLCADDFSTRMDIIREVALFVLAGSK